MDDERLRQTLEAMGNEMPAPPRAAFADELEVGLLAGSAPHDAGGEPDADRSGWLRPAMLAVAAAVLVAVLFVGLRDGPDAEALTVAAATDAVVELPDGKVTDLRPGDTVVDGSIIRTGRDGSAEVDGIVLGPDEAARVVDGEVDVITDRPPTTDAVRPTDGPPATDGVRPTDGPRSTTGASDGSRPGDDQRDIDDSSAPPAPAPDAPSPTDAPDPDRTRD